MDKSSPPFMMSDGETGVGDVMTPGGRWEKAHGAWPKGKKISPIATVFGDQ
jgi:hypothetical protein